MNHVEGNFKGVRSLNIYYQGWLPDEKIKAVLLVVHGLGEHCGRYMNLVNHFVPLGYAVYGLDHIGHGKSEGRREYVERFTDFTETLAIFSKMVAEWQAGKSIFLFGHSMGGAIATYYLLDNQEEFKGAIISAPLVKVGESVSPATITMGKLLSKILPRMGVVEVDVNALSRDPAVVEAYINDPLVFHGKTPARLGGELLVAMERITKEAVKLTLPLLIVQGAEDVLANPYGARMLFEKANCADKHIKIYDGMYHEIFNEPDCNRVLVDVEEWLDYHLDGVA